MTALTQLDAGNHSTYRLLETISITNQTANSTAVTKAIKVPEWARYATFVIDNLTMGGTTPLFDFNLSAVNVALNQIPDSDDLIFLGGWDGITQKTAAAGTNTTIDVGPDVTVDDTGSATASDRYAVQAALPPWIAYTYTTDGTTDDEDYSGTISVYWRR